MSTPRKTMDQALQHLLKHVPHVLLTNNAAVIGPPERHLHVSLDNYFSRTMGDYDTLDLTLFVGDQKVQTYRLDLTEAQYRPAGATGVPDHRNGYWWSYGEGGFYGWEPDPVAIAKRVFGLLGYHNITAAKL